MIMTLCKHRVGWHQSSQCTMSKLWKQGLKWSSLNKYFSADFQRKWTKFWWMVYKHPKNWKINLFSKYLEKNIVKTAKNLLGVLSQGKSGVKKIVFKNGKHFRKCVFCDNTPKYWKNAFKVWKIKITNIFSMNFPTWTSEIFGRP